MTNRNVGLFSLLMVGGFVAWRNRYQLQRFFESKGVKTPIDTSNLKSTVRSGIAKVTGKAEKLAKELPPSREAV